MIFLYGPAGTGKSTVGKILADALELPFVDLDLAIETQAGQSIPQIFAQEGETGFRRREQQAMQQAVAGGEQVIALGGGALMGAGVRPLAEAHGVVVCLAAPLETLVTRLQADELARPLLAGELHEKLSGLLERRADHYASFDVQIETAGFSPAEVAWQIQVRLGVFRLRAMAGARHAGYDARVAGLDRLGEMLRVRGLKGPLVVVSDVQVAGHYLTPLVADLEAAGYAVQALTLPAGEEHKTLESVARLWQGFLDGQIERGSTVLALGGGVIGDLTGFAAATFLRGVPWVNLPTSLLAMVDASLGGKTGADLPQGKNLIGAFHPPRLVLVDPAVLATLPPEELRSGLAEVVKHGVIADPGLFALCGQVPSWPVGEAGVANWQALVSRAMAIKVQVIEADPYERGIRAGLNLGHTVGHGVELVSGFRVRHGEAVAIGMVVEARFAEQLGLAEAGLSERIAARLTHLGLPVAIPPELDRTAIAAAMQRDKKKAGGIVRFALPVRIGAVEVGVEVPDWEVWLQAV